MGKEQFLKMLIAQLQNQDPMNPMQGDQMATQLATFSSLEQLQNINTTLTAQTGSQDTLLGAMRTTAAIGTIGHHVVAAGNQVEIGGDATTNVTADIGTAGTGTLHIFDASGKEVGSRNLGAVRGGHQTIALGSAADGLDDGTYTYSIDVKDAAGAAVSVSTFMTGRVDSVKATASGLSLTAGGLTIPYGSVVQILD
jgi:flagellar basal-body rod modification protein FlgD